MVRYTKDRVNSVAIATLSRFFLAMQRGAPRATIHVRDRPLSAEGRITSYNVCYTKLLRTDQGLPADGADPQTAGWRHGVKPRAGGEGRLPR